MLRRSLVIGHRTLSAPKRFCSTSWKDLYSSEIQQMWARRANSFACAVCNGENKETCPCAKTRFVSKLTLNDLDNYYNKTGATKIDLKHQFIKRMFIADAQACT